MNGLQCASGRKLARLLFVVSLTAAGTLAAGACGKSEATAPTPRPGETVIVYRLVPDPGVDASGLHSLQAEEILAARLSSLGAGGWAIESFGSDRLLVQIDRLSDVDALRPWLRARGKFTMAPLPPDVYGTYDSATGVYVLGTKPLPVRGDAIEAQPGLDFAGASLDRGSVTLVCAVADCATGSGYKAAFSLGGLAAYELESWSGEHPNQCVAFVLDGKVFDGTCPVGPGLPRLDARGIVAVLSKEPLLVTLREESFQVGPSPAAS